MALVIPPKFQRIENAILYKIAISNEKGITKRELTGSLKINDSIFNAAFKDLRAKSYVEIEEKRGNEYELIHNNTRVIGEEDIIFLTSKGGEALMSRFSDFGM